MFLYVNVDCVEYFLFIDLLKKIQSTSRVYTRTQKSYTDV